MAEQDMSFLRKRLLQIQQKTREEYDAIESTEKESANDDCSDDNQSTSTDKNVVKPASRRSDSSVVTSKDHSPQESNDGTSGYSSSNSLEPDYCRNSVGRLIRKPLPNENLWSSEMNEELNGRTDNLPGSVCRQQNEHLTKPYFSTEYRLPNELNDRADAFLSQIACERTREPYRSNRFTNKPPSDSQETNNYSVRSVSIKTSKIPNLSQWSIEDGPTNDFSRNSSEPTYTEYDHIAPVSSDEVSNSDQWLHDDLPVDDFVQQLYVQCNGTANVSPSVPVSISNWHLSGSCSVKGFLGTSFEPVSGKYNPSVLSSNVPTLNSCQWPRKATSRRDFSESSASCTKLDSNVSFPSIPISNVDEWPAIDGSKDSVVPVLQQYNNLMESSRNRLNNNDYSSVANQFSNRLAAPPSDNAYVEPTTYSPANNINGALNSLSTENDQNSVYEEYDNIANIIPRHPIPPLNGLIQRLQNSDTAIVPQYVRVANNVAQSAGLFVGLQNFSIPSQQSPATVLLRSSQLAQSKIAPQQNALNYQFATFQLKNTQNDSPSRDTSVAASPKQELQPDTRKSVSLRENSSAFRHSERVQNSSCQKIETRTASARQRFEVVQNSSCPNNAEPRKLKSPIACDEHARTCHRYDNNSRTWHLSETSSRDCSNGDREKGHYRKRIEYTPQEERQLADSLSSTYGCENFDSLLDSCFNKAVMLTSVVSWHSKRKNDQHNDMYKFEKWDADRLQALQDLKQKLNSVKAKLDEFDLNEWHRHTRSTNLANLIMKRLRSDIKVEFLTQAWCKFYEIMYKFKLIPKAAQKEKRFYSIHLCEAPGAFVASLNHYLQLNYPDLEWHWKANSLNPYYEGNHLSAMINDDRFMLLTIKDWDFGPDMTGDITHPDYPNYLREKCGSRLPHLVTADGSFDCQDRPEEQENSVSWLHLKETLTALNVLRTGGHFVIKMFTFFECDTVCLMFLLKCVFESVDVFKPATSKEGNSEVYVVCRQYKNEPIFKPYLRKLLSISYEDHQKYAMFPFERMSRIFLDDLLRCSRNFAVIQMRIILRNIRLYPRTRDEVLRREFEYAQEKLFEKYVKTYDLKPIPLHKTIVRVPYRKFENRFSVPKVIEERDHKQGSHNDQLKRASLLIKELVKKIVDEVHESLSSRIQKITLMPKVKLDTTDFAMKFGKPIESVYSSQFCHGTYIRIRNELINALGQTKYNLVMSDMKGSIMVKDDPDFCDFTSIYMLQSNYNMAQILCFQKLYSRLATLRCHDSLKLFGFPILTQFNVSVLCILGQMFQEVSFEAPNKLYLRNLVKETHHTWMKELEKIHCIFDKNEKQAVISILPIDRITGIGNQFYSWIIETNNARVLNEIDLAVYYYN